MQSLLVLLVTSLLMRVNIDIVMSTGLSRTPGVQVATDPRSYSDGVGSGTQVGLLTVAEKCLYHTTFKEHIACSCI